MEIRKAGKRDISAIVDLWWEMQDSHHVYDPEYYRTRSEAECREISTRYFRQIIGAPDHGVFLALEADRLVGMLHMAIRSKPPIFQVRSYAMLEEVVVAPSHRKKGIFRDLFTYAEEMLRSRDIHLLELLVDRENQPAISAYKGVGFIERQAMMIRWI